MEELKKLVVDFRDRRNWKQFHNPKDLSISLLLEASELLEHFQWKNFEEMAEHIIKKKEDIGEELADILYWVLLISNDLDIDIESAFKDKIEKNEKKYPVEKSKDNHKKYTEI
jgi:NTP pyrophosphatase (non-canonical NTP hydrolase)